MSRITGTRHIHPDEEQRSQDIPNDPPPSYSEAMSTRFREVPVASSSAPLPCESNAISSNDLSTPKPSAPPLDNNPAVMPANIGFVDVTQEPITSQPAMQFTDTRYQQPAAKNYVPPDSYQHNYTQTQTQAQHINNQNNSTDDCCQACLLCVTACDCIVSCCHLILMIVSKN